MVFKTIILCASAFLVQSISGNCVRPSCGSISISNCGGDLIATSIGPISPSGIAVAADLNLDGKLDIAGTLPFLSAVGFEGTYPTTGSAAVSYGCGDGNIGIQNVIGGSGSSISSIGGCGCKY